ncbi:MAG: hypothetical protein KU38_03500 [Sulfurovum sp. FS08-3]|nr:MAG: hypothetical protein KU38_03500 [Sulfurovum sp. FS08-3]
MITSIKQAMLESKEPTNSPYINKVHNHIIVTDSKPIPKPTQKFRCEGKVWCSQMSSCQEATFYIQNCPNTKMDGDGDGIPCRKQWCH